MTRNKRRGWAAAHQDLTNTDHGRMSRRRGSIPAGVDPATKLAAVKAAAATRKRPKIERMTLMHDATKADLVGRLQKLTADERTELMAEAAAVNKADEAESRAASALSDFIHPTRKA